MADTEESLNEYLNKLESSLEEIKSVEFRWQDNQSDFAGITVQEISPLTTYTVPLTTYTVSGGGTSHPLYGAVPNVVIGGGGGVTSSPVWTTTTTNQTIQPIGQSGAVHIQGENADLVIGDKSMKAWMEKVEERLNILTPNPTLEKEWDDLRRLGERYRKLEKKCKEKTEVWNKLKSMPRPKPY